MHLPAASTVLTHEHPAAPRLGHQDEHLEATAVRRVPGAGRAGSVAARRRGLSATLGEEGPGRWRPGPIAGFARVTTPEGLVTIPVLASILESILENAPRDVCDSERRVGIKKLPTLPRLELRCPIGHRAEMGQVAEGRGAQRRRLPQLHTPKSPFSGESLCKTLLVTLRFTRRVLHRYAVTFKCPGFSLVVTIISYCLNTKRPFPI